MWYRKVAFGIRVSLDGVIGNAIKNIKFPLTKKVFRFSILSIAEIYDSHGKKVTMSRNIITIIIILGIIIKGADM